MPKKERRIVTRKIDPEQAPPLSRGQKAELAALAKMPDARIDYSDIPEAPAGFWDNAVRTGLYKPVKRQLTVRIDADILAWLKSTGAGYHSRLNQILRSAMLRELRSRS
jgi:uncharacterized protein (DUF4415 family)